MRIQVLGRYIAAILTLTLVASGCASRDQATQRNPNGSGAAAPTGQQTAPQARPEGKPGGTLTIAISRDLTLLNPLVQTGSTNHSIREMSYESLLALDEQGNAQPKLAERWEASPDGKVYTFHLRRGVKFHDGQEMTAEDLKWVFDYVMNPRNGAYGFPQMEPVQQVEVAGPHTLRVMLKGASPAFIPALTDIRAILAVPKGSVQEGVDKPTSAPPGTGPFKFVEWQPRQRIVFERFDDYWGHKAYLDGVILRPIADGSVRFTALRAGDVDAVERTPNEWVREVLDGKVPGLGIVESKHSGLRNLKFNVADPPMDNLKLRLAVAHALDRKEFMEAAYFGLGRPADQMYPEGHVWYVPGLQWPAYDLDKARQKLREAGYNGQEIPILIEPGIQEIEATAIQAQLRKIGMNTRLDVAEGSAAKDRDQRGDFAFLPSGGSTDPDPSATYGPDFKCPADLRKRGANLRGYCSREVDALIERLETELDQAKRKDVLRQMMVKLTQDLPELYIGFAPRYFTYRDYVKAFPVDAAGRWMPQDAGLNYTWLDK
jgi:peptide/nickel transport system substrate-binding protein